MKLERETECAAQRGWTAYRLEDCWCGAPTLTSLERLAGGYELLQAFEESVDDIVESQRLPARNVVELLK